MSDHMEFGLTSRESSPNREAANRHTKGGKKYSETISKDMKSSGPGDNTFTFSKPTKHGRLEVVCECPKCSSHIAVTKNTVMVICRACNSLFPVRDDVIISIR